MSIFLWRINISLVMHYSFPCYTSTFFLRCMDFFSCNAWNFTRCIDIFLLQCMNSFMRCMNLFSRCMNSFSCNAWLFHYAWISFLVMPDFFRVIHESLPAMRNIFSHNAWMSSSDAWQFPPSARISSRDAWHFSRNAWLISLAMNNFSFPRCMKFSSQCINLSCDAWHFLWNAWISFSWGMSLFPAVYVIFPALHE